MSGDLDYFQESDLNRSNIEDFYKSLPSEELKEQFNNSLDIEGKLPALNVLQGYRGPHTHTNGSSGNSDTLGPSYGLQEIKHYWGPTKHINWAPLVGSVSWIGMKAASVIRGDFKWHSLYFDSKTGECLSHDINIAATKLDSKGSDLYKQDKYSEAAEYHKNAYYSCSEYKNKQSCEHNWYNAEAAELNKEGDKLKSEKRYDEAIEKYQQAYDKCPDIEGDCRNNRTMYQINKAAAQKAAREDAARTVAAEIAVRKKTARKIADEKAAREEAVRKTAEEKAAREEAARKTAEEKAAREEVARKAAEEKVTKLEAANEKAKQESEQKGRENNQAINNHATYQTGSTLENSTQAKIVEGNVLNQMQRMEAINLFDGLMNGNLSSDLMSYLHRQLDTLVDINPEPEIVNRLLVLSLRKERNKKTTELENCDLQNINDLKSKIMELIDNEIEMIEKLIMEGKEQVIEKLKDEFDELEKELENMNGSCNFDNFDEVNIHGMAARDEHTGDRVLEMATESHLDGDIAHYFHLERETGQNNKSN